ncbi:hypothetical protein BN871_BV_00070 [Paenibacillus sp. P22]|nr:hypothetical protein BN871_BV_00070 [Paenibacillus sp. P22]
MHDKKNQLQPTPSAKAGFFIVGPQREAGQYKLSSSSIREPT